MARTRKPSGTEIHEIFRRFRSNQPEPRGELNSLNHFTLLVAVVLSAQATDQSVNRATEALFKVAPTPEKMAALGEDGLTPYIKTIGLYRGKARNIVALAKALIERHGSQVPRRREDLEALPGVGRKTASVVLNQAYGEPTIAVDTHVFRVGNRTGLATGGSVGEVERQLERRVPAEFKRHAHHWLILHGRYVCKARKPQCHGCIIRDLCRFTPKTPAPSAGVP
jgi:endonuclease-3